MDVKILGEKIILWKISTRTYKKKPVTDVAISNSNQSLIVYITLKNNL